ncbi:MAG: hypothetical protein ACYC7F_13500 [Gemmatimonadaceae bacterium]
MLLTSVAAAQESRERQPPPRVPGSFQPPAGLCRLWIDGVPASQQPAPTDCANAIRNRPSNAAVLFGPPLRSAPMEMQPFARRSGKLPIRQLAPGIRKDGRDDGRAEPRGRTADTTAKPAPRKPEKPQ